MNDNGGDLFTYETSRAWKRAGTSAEAARQASVKAPMLRARCLDVIASTPGGLTADEVAQRLQHDKCSIRARVSELFRLEKIADSGTRRKSALGGSATVWTARREMGAAA
jgi:hypothetical protein